MPRAPSNAPCARQAAGRFGAAPGLAVLCLGLSIAAATAEEREPLLPVAREVKETQQQPAPAAEAEPKAQTAAARSDWRPAPSAGRSPYDALIARYAAAYDVPLPIAHAVIKKESGYNANATGLGTVGLMQIKPATARGIGYTGTTKGLYDPETNLTWGMKYLARAYQLGGRDVCGMALRYQGGHRATRMTAASREYCADLKRILATSGASEFAVARDTAPAAEPVVAAAFAPLPEPRPTPALLAAAEAAEAAAPPVAASSKTEAPAPAEPRWASGAENVVIAALPVPRPAREAPASAAPTPAPRLLWSAYAPVLPGAQGIIPAAFRLPAGTSAAPSRAEDGPGEAETAFPAQAVAEAGLLRMGP